MSSWIGIPGALIEIACPSSEDMETEQVVSELVPFSGQRMVQVGKGVRRSWSIGKNVAFPRDMAVLDQLAYGWQGALSWIGAQAAVTNLLTPGQAAFTEGHVSYTGGAQAFTGARECGGEWAARWAGGVLGSTVRIGFDKLIPVVPSRPLTVRAWVQASSPSAPPRLARWWFDAAGVMIAPSAVDISEGWAEVSSTPPPGAATVRLEWRDCAVVAFPQVTLTPTIKSVSAGRGVHRVHLSAASDSVIAAHSGLTASSTSFTLREVG